MGARRHKALAAAFVALALFAAAQPVRIAYAAENSRGEPITEADEGQLPSLWVLAIGVSKYQDPKLNLKYADDDANAIASVFEEQKGLGYYREVHTKRLLNKEVTRANINNEVAGFLGKAGPSDVVVIFLAGHGVRYQDLYYFMPHSATPETVMNEGWSISELKNRVKALRTHVKKVVVLVDTCEAGGVGRGIGAGDRAKEIVAEIKATEGMYILLSSQSGQSLEDPKWKHGAFTFATLEGLHGKADENADGNLSVNELFNYVANAVPEMTDGRQHPSQDTKGGRLWLAAMHKMAKPPAEVAAPRPAMEAAKPPEVDPNSIFVMPFRNLSNKDRDTQQFTGEQIQDELYNRLSQIKTLDVRVPNSLVIEDTAHPLATLREARIARAIEGTFTITGNRVVMKAWIADTITGRGEHLGSVEDEYSDVAILRLSKKLTDEVVVALDLNVSAGESTALKSVQDLLGAEGGSSGDDDFLDQAAPAGSKPTPTREPHALHQSQSGWIASVYDVIVPAAYGEDASIAITRVLDAYKRAYQDKDIDDLQKLYVSFSASQADALRSYLNNADGLEIELAEVQIETREDRARVSYIRRDHFTEKGTGKEVNLEVRLKKNFVLDNGEWKFAGS